MRGKITIYILLFISMFTVTAVNGGIRFGARDSAISVLNNSTFHLTYTLTVNTGTIKKKDNASIVDKDIIFYDGIYEPENSMVFLTGDYITEDEGVIRLNGTLEKPEVLRADAGMRIKKLEVSGPKNRLEGFPLFESNIELMDKNTTLTIAINSTLNKNIELNGGMIILEDDLELADGVSLTGPGTIALNDRRLSFGTEDLDITSSLYWIGAADVYLSGKIDLSASWSFEGECYFNADSTILNLVNGGNLTVMNDSSLSVRQLKISKLNPDLNQMIFFEDTSNAEDDYNDLSSSVLRIRRAALEITTTYTFDTGHLIVEVGSGQLITRNNGMVFGDRGFLTVDGVNAYYKTRTFPDSKNVRSEPDVPYDAANSHIKLLNNADLYHFRTFRAHNEGGSSYGVGGNKFLGDTEQFLIEAASPDINGNSWYFHFARNVTNLITFQTSSIDATFRDVVLKDFRPYHVELTSDSSLTFKNNTIIELGDDISLTDATSNSVTWTFQGNCKIDGKGKTVDLSQGGILVEDLDGTDPSTLVIQDMIIEGLKDGAIAIDSSSNGSKIIFKDVKFFLAEDFEFDKGFFEISGKVEIYPDGDNDAVQFTYNTDSTSPSVIQAGSTLHLGRGVTFRYAPSTANKNLIDFQNVSSELSLRGATLDASNVGWELTDGTLIVDHKCFVSNDATGPTEAISFGNGTLADDLNIEIMPGGNIEVTNGILEYNNAGG